MSGSDEVDIDVITLTEKDSNNRNQGSVSNPNSSSVDPDEPGSASAAGTVSPKSQSLSPNASPLISSLPAASLITLENDHEVVHTRTRARASHIFVGKNAQVARQNGNSGEHRNSIDEEQEEEEDDEEEAVSESNVKSKQKKLSKRDKQQALAENLASLSIDEEKSDVSSRPIDSPASGASIPLSTPAPFTFDPSHTIRDRLMDLSHPRCTFTNADALLSSTAPNGSILGVFELVLQFETFKNIDLFRQGLYAVRAQFFTLGAANANPAYSASNGNTDNTTSSSSVFDSPTTTTSVNRSMASSTGVGSNAASTSESFDIAHHASDPSSSPRASASSSATNSTTNNSGSRPTSPQHAAAQHSAPNNFATPFTTTGQQILHWESLVNDLNAPIPRKDGADDKEAEDARSRMNSETVMPQSEGVLQLRKHKVALPYYILADPSSLNESDSSGELFNFADKPVYPSSIADHSNHFLSRAFRIQYCEQEIVLNDACLFRLELNLKKIIPVYLELELLFAEYTIADASRNRPTPTLDEFKVVSRHLYCLDDIYTKGTHSFSAQHQPASAAHHAVGGKKSKSRSKYAQSNVSNASATGYEPVVFDDNHFCSIQTMVHSQLIDIKFRPAPVVQRTTKSHDRQTSNSTSSSASNGENEPTANGNENSSAEGQPKVATGETSSSTAQSISGVASSIPILSAFISTTPATEESQLLSSASASTTPNPIASSTVTTLQASASANNSFSHSRNSSAAAPVTKPTFPTHSLAQLLFPRMMLSNPNKVQTNPSSMMQLANDYHQLFVSNLITSYNNLAKSFALYKKHCVSGLQRTTYAEALTIPPICLPPSMTPNPTSEAEALASEGKHRDSQPGLEETSRSRSRTASSSGKGKYPNQAWSTSQKVEAPPSPQRRSSIESLQQERERHEGGEEELRALHVKYHIPPLYTMAYRIRHHPTQTACCVWEFPDLAASIILEDLQEISKQIFTLWNQFQSMLTVCTSQIMTYERRAWNKLQTQKWGHFLLRESFNIEDRWRVGHVNIATMHEKTVNHLRAKGSLTRACHTLPLMRDCNPTLQPHEQVILFEEEFKSPSPEEENNTDVSKEFEIIDSHFDENADRNSTVISQGNNSASEPSISSASSSSGLPRRPSFHEPVLSVSAEKSMHEAGRFSDSAGDAVLPTDLPRENRESQVGQAAAVLKAPIDVDGNLSAVKGTGNNGGKPRLSQVVDFDAISHRLSESSRLRRLASQAASEHPYDGKHFIVLCHGYQGNSWDMRILKNHFSLLFPHAQIFASAANENNTEGDIAAMGKRLAEELVATLNEQCKELGRLSFVCHSLGGIIVRSALTNAIMEPYYPKLYTYISLASPHCGYLFSDNSMLNTGIWFLRKWNKSACLSQLSLTDADEPTDCFLYQLAKKDCLGRFRHVYLFASQQDKYAPFHSARIEIHPVAVNDRKKGTTFHNMVSSILGPLGSGVDFRRFDLWFVPKKRNIDSFIGRTAHINFLTHSNYMRMIAHLYSHLFQ